MLRNEAKSPLMCKKSLVYKNCRLTERTTRLASKSVGAGHSRPLLTTNPLNPEQLPPLLSIQPSRIDHAQKQSSEYLAQRRRHGSGRSASRDLEKLATPSRFLTGRLLYYTVRPVSLDISLAKVLTAGTERHRRVLCLPSSALRTLLRPSPPSQSLEVLLVGA